MTQVLFDSPTSTVARGVECVDYRGGVHRYYADKEIVLSAGTFGSPKILFNSGIGPESTLAAFGKPLRKISPNVGQRIRNQQGLSMQWQDTSLTHVNFYWTDPANIAFTQYGTDYYTPAQNVELSVKVNPDHPINDILIGQDVGTSSASSPFGETFQLSVTLTYNNYANGTLNLTTSDPLGPTLWSTNYFEIEDDVNTLALGILKAREVMSQWPSSGNLTELYPGPQYATYDQLVDFIYANRSSLTIQCHYHSSVYVGTHESSPLDPRMRVRGIQRLRVADASSAGGQVSIGMQATATVLGLKGANLIIEDHRRGGGW